jgi:hypothetical protein
MGIGKAILCCSALVFVSANATSDDQPQANAAATPRFDFVTPACDRYFLSANWRFDAGPKLWSLSLVPTPCTRSLRGQLTSTGLVIDAVIRDQSGNAHWLEGNNTRGMRDQIICHLDKLTTKEEWNVEPGRPDVGYAETVRRDCNP